MQGISIREFGRRDGCSDTLVRKALKAGHLTAFGDGSVDPALVGGDWRPRNRRGANPANQAQTAKLVRTGETPAEAAERIVAVEGQAPYNLAEAERIKENYLALLRQLEFDTKSGAVVPVDVVIAGVADQYAKVRTKLLGLPTRIAPRAAVLRSAEEVRALIEAEVIQALHELSLDGHGDVDLSTLREAIRDRFGSVH